MLRILEDRNPDFLIFRRGFHFETTVSLEAIDINHLKSLRLYHHDKIVEIRDGDGSSWLYSCEQNSKNMVFLEGTHLTFPEEFSLRIGGAIPKGSRLDFLLQKCTEIGVTEFHFTNFERSVRSDFSPDRAERVIVEAASQSKRTHLPKILFYKNWEDLLSTIPVENLAYLDPYGERSLRAIESKDRLFMIGPEGGFGSEKKRMEELGIPSWKLGANILRMETAYIYMASLQSQMITEKA